MFFIFIFALSLLLVHLSAGKESGARARSFVYFPRKHKPNDDNWISRIHSSLFLALKVYSLYFICLCVSICSCTYIYRAIDLSSTLLHCRYAISRNVVLRFPYTECKQTEIENGNSELFDFKVFDDFQLYTLGKYHFRCVSREFFSPHYTPWTAR